MTMMTIPELMTRFGIDDFKSTLIDLFEQKLVEFECPGVAVESVYPRSSPAPGVQAIITVQRSHVAEEGAGIGRVLGQAIDTLSGEEITTEGAWQREETEVTIWAGNGDLRDWLFIFVRGIVFAEMPDLQRLGFRDVLLTSSGDDEIDDQLITNFYWFRSTCGFSCRTEIRADYSVPLATAVDDEASLITMPVPTIQPSQPFLINEDD